MIHEIETYGDLLRALQSLTHEQLQQPVQVADSPSTHKPVEMQAGIAIGTVGGFQFEGARSTHDNRYHADDVCILVDGNPFAEDGALGYTLETHETGGRPVIRNIPIYGKDGPTARELQMATDLQPVPPDFPQHVVKTIRHRSEGLDDWVPGRE